MSAIIDELRKLEHIYKGVKTTVYGAAANRIAELEQQLAEPTSDPITKEIGKPFGCSAGDGNMRDLNADEREAIQVLERLANQWPETLWLFSASGSLWVMRKDDHGAKSSLSTQGYDPEYALTSIDIENDGGDWCPQETE